MVPFVWTYTGRWQDQSYGEWRERPAPVALRLCKIFTYYSPKTVLARYYYSMKIWIHVSQHATWRHVGSMIQTSNHGQQAPRELRSPPIFWTRSSHTPVLGHWHLLTPQLPIKRRAGELWVGMASLGPQTWHAAQPAGSCWPGQTIQQDTCLALPLYVLGPNCRCRSSQVKLTLTQ